MPTHQLNRPSGIVVGFFGPRAIFALLNNSESDN